jgi:hypothetical protein
VTKCENKCIYYNLIIYLILISKIENILSYEVPQETRSFHVVNMGVPDCLMA